jgi:ribosomal-protein-alanine N-acetyltransferase
MPESPPEAGSDPQPAGAAEADLLAALHAEAFPDDPWSAAAFRTLCRMPGAGVRLAADAEGPAGLVLWRVAADEAEVVTLGVRPAARRRGHAVRLLRAAMRDAAAAGAGRMLLEVAADNDAAAALYAGLGFAAVGRRRGYYRRAAAAACDAILLAAPLPAK